MPEIGDRIEVTSFKAGPRAGTVAAIDGQTHYGALGFG
jgi:hypothetical protein